MGILSKQLGIEFTNLPLSCQKRFINFFGYKKRMISKFRGVRKRPCGDPGDSDCHSGAGQQRAYGFDARVRGVLIETARREECRSKGNRGLTDEACGLIGNSKTQSKKSRLISKSEASIVRTWLVESVNPSWSKLDVLMETGLTNPTSTSDAVL